MIGLKQSIKCNPRVGLKRIEGYCSGDEFQDGQLHYFTSTDDEKQQNIINVYVYFVFRLLQFEKFYNSILIFPNYKFNILV